MSFFVQLRNLLEFFAFYLYPILLIIIFGYVEITYLPDAKGSFFSEYNIVELSQELELFLCLLFSFWFFFKINKKEHLLKVWIGLAFLGCLYVTGEEISWGQTFFQWSTPTEWAAINGQEETNLHNNSHLLNQFPKALLELGVLMGGIVIPLLQKFKKPYLPDIMKPIFADKRLMPIAFTALMIKLLELAPRILGYRIFERKSEVIETFLYHFVFLYLICIYQKWRQKTPEAK